MTYPSGWSIVAQTLVRRERWPGGLRVKGIPLVYPGQEVQPDQPIIRVERQAELVDEKRNAVSYSASVTPVNAIAMGNGTANGSNGVRSGETILAGLRGRVVDLTRRGGVVIESRAALVQGALGAGGQVAGVLAMWQAPTYNHQQPSLPPGAILIIPGPLNLAMLRQAMSSNISGVIASSISSRDLESFLQTDLLQLVESRNVDLVQEHPLPLTLLLTEGLGTLAMPAHTIELLSKYQGSMALLTGATSTRQAIFPELVVSLPAALAQENWHPVQPDPLLVVGAHVRVCAGEYEGTIGEINHLFTHQQVFPSGVRARAARLRLEDSSTLVIPLTLLERVG
jgi:hypothetical protein